MSKGFPIDLDSLLASIAEILKQNGNARELAILVDAEARGEQTGYDNLNGGTYLWSVFLNIDLRLYTILKNSLPDANENDSPIRTHNLVPQSALDKAEEIILEAGQNFFSTLSEDQLYSVAIRPRPVVDKQWREQAKEYLKGGGITNQGRVRSDNPASLRCDGLLFRSEPEINLYKALKKRGVTFAPLPVFLRGGKDYRRAEPDFFIVRSGIAMVVEVDGSTYHRETPAEAEEKRRFLDIEGVKITHVKAADCMTEELADKCATDIIQRLEKYISQR